LLVPIGILAGCYLINIFSARRVLANLELTAPETARAEENGRVDRGWIATNHGDQPIGEVTVSTGRRELFVIPQLEAHTSTHPVPEATFRRRGIYEHGDVIVRTRFPFGLVEVNRPLHLPGRTIVHPAIRELPPPAASGYDVMVGGRYRGQRQATTGDFFSGVREHRPGDSLRQIHWPSSAKGLGLMVRTYEEELSGRVAIVLIPCPDPAVLDEAVRLAGSLAFAALDEGHHVEFIDLASLTADLIPPFDDGQSLLDRLAALPTDDARPTPERLHAAVDRLSRKAALHFIFAPAETTATTSGFLEELETSGRKVFVHHAREVAG
jgi:uncharacterized protein (DUF58 family)